MSPRTAHNLREYQNQIVTPDACEGCTLSMRCRIKHKFATEINVQLRQLSVRDNYHGVLALIEDIFVIGAAILLFFISPYFFPLSVLIIGSRQRALATLLHESSHKTLALNPVINLLLGTVFSGYWILQSWYAYLYSHVYNHHPYLGDENKDPDIVYYIKQGLLDQSVNPHLLRHHIWRTLLGARTIANVKYLLLNRLFPRYLISKSIPIKSQDRHKAILEYIAFVLFWIVLLSCLWKFGLLFYFFILWIIPYLTTFQVINWFIELSEHYPLTRSSDYDLYMSRNRLGSQIEQFFTGMHGESWHLIHHLRPGIPFWSMKKAHAILLQDKEYRAATSLSGGIFTQGPYGAPSILVSMQRQLEDGTHGVSESKLT